MNYNLGYNSKKNIEGIHPDIKLAVEEAIKITKQDFMILSTGGVRTDEQQANLYARGRTVRGTKVTWTKNSMHQYGLAVDLVAYVNGRPNWEDKYYAEIAKAMKTVIRKRKLPIDWGYDLWKKDKAHWQITKLEDKDAREVFDVRK